MVYGILNIVYSLQVADMLEVERIGPQHQAGSDSLLTGRAFFKMTEIYFEDELDDTKVTSLITSPLMKTETK